MSSNEASPASQNAGPPGGVSPGAEPLATQEASSPSEALVAVRNVTKAFGKLHALDNFTMSIRPGETYGLIGPNGSGKTTLIRIIVGLTKPTAGEVSILGHKMPNRQVAKDVGYMTQSNALYQELSVRENLEFFGRIYGLRNRRLKE